MRGLSGYISNSRWIKITRIGHFNGTQWKFGKYVHRRPLQGSFLPIFWDVPTCNMHAVEDIGAVVDWLTELVAVLHNHNDMINLFRAM